MKLMKDISQPFEKENLRTVSGYSGICDGCGTPVETDDVFTAILLVSETVDALCPLTVFYCPACNKRITVMRLYKNLNITSELDNMVKR